jgi:hypothetical protein
LKSLETHEYKNSARYDDKKIRFILIGIGIPDVQQGKGDCKIELYDI